MAARPQIQMIDRLRFSIPSIRPQEDAIALRDALKASTSQWPIPGTWVIGYKSGRVIAIFEIPWAPVKHWKRTGLLKLESFLVEEPQTRFALEQIKERWPESLEMPRPDRESLPDTERII